MITDDPTLIGPALKDLKATFQTGKTLDVKFRKQQLTYLVRGLQELEIKFHQALKEDLNASLAFSMAYSLGTTISIINYYIKEVENFAKPISVDTPLLYAPGKSYMIPEPLGVALVLGTWNYPLLLTVPYLAGAISAGNCVIVKPSELAPHISNVIAELMDKYLDKNCYRCIEGGIEVAQEIIKQPFDVIVFTGSVEKGKLIAKAAAENLTPCVLELGGKNPAIVNKEADLQSAVLRIARARMVNCGQTCMAPDYVFVQREIKNQFIEGTKKAIIQFYGEDASKSPDYSRIINVNHTKRLKSYLSEDHGGKVLMGGEVRVDEKYVAPTLIESPRDGSKLMTDEIFGPIMTIFEFEDIDEVIKFINKNPKPLGIHYYGSAKSDAFQQLKFRTSSGGLTTNESFAQGTNIYLAFGGVGNSGQGVLNGYHTFKSCSHFKPIMECNTNNRFPASLLFPPYSEKAKDMLKKARGFMNMKQSTVVKGGLLLIFVMMLFLYSLLSFSGIVSKITK